MQKVMLPALTGVRGFGAVMVVIFHSSYFLERGFGIEHFSVADTGYLGVDLFFILSGFIIAHVHLQDFQRPSWRAFGRFLWLRLSRIYPVHLFTLLAKVGVLVALWIWGTNLFGSSRYTAEMFLANLVLVQDWGLFYLVNWNQPSWSISAEWFAYLAFPLLAMALFRIRSITVAAVCAGLALGGLVVVFRWGLGLDNIHSNIMQYGLIRAAGEFSCGAFLYLIYRSRALSSLPWGLIATAAFVLFCAQLWVWQADFSVLPTIAVLILSLAEGRGFAAAFMTSRPMFFLGEISYSIYMVHKVAFDAATLAIEHSRFVNATGPVIMLAFVAALLLAVPAIWFTHLYVEKPSRAYLRRMIGARQPVPAP